MTKQLEGSLSEADLAKLHPVLFHMVELGGWENIRRHGLLSTTDLLDLFEVAPRKRPAIEARPRPESMVLEHPVHGRAVIRDNKPLRRGILERCLIDTTVEEWCRLLNSHVYFWPTRERLDTLLNAKHNRTRDHEVIALDTRALLSRHAHRVRLVPINSGSALYPNAPTRSADTFAPVHAYPYEQYRLKRGRLKAITEIAIQGSILDIEDITISVETHPSA